MTICTGPIQAQIELPTDGKVFASSNIQGRLLHILVERGDQVKAGDILAEVESLELKNWQLELLQTRVLLNLTKTSLDRMQPLSGGGSVPQRKTSGNSAQSTRRIVTPSKV